MGLRCALVVAGLIAPSGCNGDGPTAEFSIGPAGGSISLAGGVVVVTFPRNAVANPVTVTATPTTNVPASPLMATGTAFEIGPLGLQLDQPVGVRIKFGSFPLPAGVRSEEMRLYTLVGNAWQLVPGSTVNVAEGSVLSALVTALGTFALLAVPVKEVIVAPANVTRAVGATAQLVATPRDAEGNTLPDRAVSWSSSAPGIAAVGPTGLVTAMSPGSASISSQAAQGTGSSSNFGVTAPSGAYPNEPPGFTPILEHSLANLPVGTNGSLGSWYNNGGPRLSVVSASDAPQSGPAVANILFPSGWPGGDSPAKFGNENETQRSALYFSKHMRIVGTDYENHPVFTKLGFIGYGRDPIGALNEGFWVLMSPGSSRISSSFLLEFRQQNHVSRNLAQNVNTAALFTVGQWHQIEVLVQLNTIGSANGILKMWLDGTLILDYSNMTYVNAANPAGFRGWKFDPTYGGIGSAKTRDDVMQVDHVYVSGVLKP